MPGNRVTQPVKGQRGEQGFSIKSASLVGDNLVLQSTSGSSYDVGNVKGAAGPAGASGSDISDPNEPDIVVDNFVSLGDGNASGGIVIPYPFDGEGLQYTQTKTLSSNELIRVYETDSETDHIGVVQLRCEHNGSSGVGLLTLGRDTSNIVDFSSLNTVTFVIKTPANSAAPGGTNPTSTNYDLYFGLFDDANNPPTNGIYFRRLNGAAWTPVCKNGGSTTTGTTTAYSSNTWYTLKIRKVSATEVGFTVNTGTEVIISTNIPTGYMNCGIMVVNNTANSNVRYLKLDFFSLKVGTTSATTTNTIVGTTNEVEVTGPVSNVITVGLPNTVIVDQVTVDQLNLDTTLTPTNPLADGVIAYDPEYQSPIMGLDGGAFNTNINAPLGSALVKLVRNNTGSVITKGQVVYINGSHGSTHITVALADASSEATAKDTIGVAAHNIANNSEGWVITQGYLKGFDTNTTPGTGGEGDTLWLSTTAGAFTYDRPIAPDHGVVVGFMVKSAGLGAGSIYVKVSNGQELEELHDVKLTSIANNDVLQWDNTDLRWENRSLSSAGIAAASHTHPLSDLTQSSAALNQVPQWNGTNWVPVTLSTGGSPGGSTGQVQYNNAGAFAGATNVKINSNNLELVKPASEPTTAPADSIVMYAKSFGQRDLPAFVDVSGWSTNLQTCIARNKFTQFNFNGGTNTASISNGMVITTTSVGTAGTAGGTVALSSTSILGGSRRQSYLTSTTAGSTTGWRASAAQCWRGNGVGRGGFFCVWKFGIGDAVLTAGGTLFVGLNDSTAAPALVVTQNPRTTTDNTMRNQVGLLLADGSLVYQICHRNGTAAATSISTGITANLTDIIEFCLYTPPNGTTIYYYLKVYADSGSNTEISGDIGTSNIPANTTLFVPHMWRGNNVSATALAVHALSFSIETPH